MSTDRNPENTRLKILKAAFDEMHQHGYQGMRVDQVLSRTGLKKGALYHHFPSKEALGYAVLEELIEKRLRELWIDPLAEFEDPLEGIYVLYERIGEIWNDEFFALGCPLNKLAQEMSPLDGGFRERISRFFARWQGAIEEALCRGQRNHVVDQRVCTHSSSLFIISTIEGILGMTKIQRDRAVYECCKQELKRYLDSLRPTSAAEQLGPRRLNP